MEDVNYVSFLLFIFTETHESIKGQSQKSEDVTEEFLIFHQSRFCHKIAFTMLFSCLIPLVTD